MEPQCFVTGEQIPRPLNLVEDGAHRLPGDKFFEWWYFDAHFDNGYHLVVALHTALFNIISRPAVIAVHLYGPGGWKKVGMTAFKPSEVSSAVGQCDVRLGPSRVWDAGNHYGVYVEQGSIRVSLEYHREIEGLQVGTGVLFADPTSEQSFHWIVPLPRASVSGWLWVDGERMAVNGIGYHDHNWGNLDLYQVLRSWTWGRVITDRHTMIFWDLLGRRIVDSRVTAAILWQGPKLLFSTDQVSLYSSKSGIGQRADAYCPDRIKLQVNDNPLAVQATLRTRRDLDTIDFAQPQSRWESTRRMWEKIYFLSEMVPLIERLVKRWVGYGTYRRLEAGCELTVATDRCSGYALYEVMDFGDMKLV
jgi:hypothetical protein